jgi:hypothetical protein
MEEIAVEHPGEENRNAPLQRSSDSEVNRNSACCYRCLDRLPRGDAFVKSLAENCSRLVRDWELRSHNGGHAGSHQGGSNAPEGISRWQGPTCLASIENDQLKGTGTAKIRYSLRIDGVGKTLLGFKQQTPSTSRLIEGAVAHEVKHGKRPLAKSSAQRIEGPSFHFCYLDVLSANRVEPLPLRLEIEMLGIARARNHQKNRQRSCERQSPRRQRNLEVADDRASRVQTEVLSRILSPEELPRKSGQPSHLRSFEIETQLNAEPKALSFYPTPTLTPDPTDPPYEERPIEACPHFRWICHFIAENLDMTLSFLRAMRRPSESAAERQ